MNDLVNDCNDQLVLWSSITESQPQVTYSAFVSDFKSMLNYFMRTILRISQSLYALEETQKEIHSSNNRKPYLQQHGMKTVVSPTCYSGLAIPVFYELAETESENLHKIMSELTPLIINQSTQYNNDTVSLPTFLQGGLKNFQCWQKGGTCTF